MESTTNTNREVNRAVGNLLIPIISHCESMHQHLENIEYQIQKDKESLKAIIDNLKLRLDETWEWSSKPTEVDNTTPASKEEIC